MTQARYDNLVKALRDRVETHPQRIAYRFHPTHGDEQCLTYAELDRRARALAVQLQMSATAGDPVLILCQPSLEYIASFYACLYAQMKAVPLYPPRNNKHIRRIVAVAEDVGINTILTTSSVQEKINTLAFDARWYEHNATIKVDWVSDELADYWVEEFPDGDTIAFLQYTSGSTGTPKGVMVTHANLCANIEIIASNLNPVAQEYHVISWLPPYHDMGLIGGILVAPYYGYTGITMPPEAFVQKPYRWLALISQYPHPAGPTPNFALELCNQKITDEEIATLDLSQWRHIFCGSEPIRHNTLKRFIERFQAAGLVPSSLMPCYGLAEATLLVTCASNRDDLTVIHLDKGALENHTVQVAAADAAGSVTLVSSGRIAGGQAVEICHPETLVPVKAGEIGEIWVAGRSVAAGYWANAPATEETFHAHLDPDAAANYLRTGDLGFFDGPELYVTGRIKDLMIINGKNHYPQDIEYTVAQAHPALVTDGGAAFTVDSGKGEEVVVVLEVKRTHRKGDFEAVYLAIRDAVAREHHLAIAEIVLISPATLAKTSSGKVQRARTRQMYLDGELTVLGRSCVAQAAATPPTREPSRQDATDNDQVVDALIAWIREYAETRVNSRLIDERRSIPPHIALDFGEQGLMGMQIPQAYGGLELNNEQALRIVEQLSAVDLTLAAFVGLNNSLGIRPILNYASEEVKQALLPRLANGRMLASFAITEPGAGSNPRNITATAKDLGDGTWSITGEKSWIGTSAWAGVISVFAKDERGRVTGFAIPQGTPGMRMGPEELTMGVRGMVQNSVLLDDARVSEKYILGRVGDGMEIAQETMSLTRLGFGTIGLGGMRRCAQLMLRYASRRQISTGRLLDNPVALNRLNTLTLRIYALEHYVRGVVRCIDRGVNVPDEALMISKILGTEYLFAATDDLMQLLGGRGYIETNIVPQLFRDARLTRIFEGPTETLYMHLGSGIYHAPQALVAFIEQQLHVPAVAQQLSQFVSTLKATYATTEGMGLDQVKDLQWSYYQLGHVVQWLLLKAVLSGETRQASDHPQHRRAVSWCEGQLAAALTAATEGRDRLAWQATQDAIVEAIGRFADNIGDIEQSAAGEQTQLDEALRRDPAPTLAPATTSPQQQLAPGTPTASAELIAVQDWVGAWLKQHLRLDDSVINADTNFGAVGLDSIQAAELMMDLGDNFAIDIDMSAAWDFPTIGTLSEAVLQLRGANNEVDERKEAVNG